MGTTAQRTFSMFFGKIDILWEKFGLSNIFLSANFFFLMY